MISPSLEEPYDTIIIGSGAAGLSAAICLSRAKQKVLVLEKHVVPGGWCHSFYINGYRFTPGVHYIGLMEKGESSNDLYCGLGIANDIAFFRMNPKGYEHCWIGEDKFHFPANFDALVNSLSQRFPHESKNIKKYLIIVRNVSRQIQLLPHVKGFWQHLTIPFRTKHMGRYGLFTLNRVMNKFIKDPLLKKVLNIQYGDHGLPPKKASFALHCCIMDHYFEGGYYPVGGGGAIVKAMTNAIKSHGGEIRTNSGVTSIITESNKKKKKAIGVILEDGTRVYAKQIISNADPKKTYIDLIGKENISTKLNKKLNKTRYSCTSLMLFLVVDMDVKKAGLDSGNIWFVNNEKHDLDTLHEEMMQPEIFLKKEFNGMFISCTTLKDPISFDGRYHTIEAITYIDYKSFEKFKNTNNERSDEYLLFKKQLEDMMLNTLEKVIPDVKSNIIEKELGTPLTNEYYINSTNGNVYGTEKNIKHIGPFAYKIESEIENLYLAGASTISHGVAGASYSGVQAASKILGCTQNDLLKLDDSQSVRIFEAEDSTNYPDWIKDKIAVKKQKQESNKEH